MLPPRSSKLTPTATVRGAPRGATLGLASRGTAVASVRGEADRIAPTSIAHRREANLGQGTSNPKRGEPMAKSSVTEVRTTQGFDFIRELGQQLRVDSIRSSTTAGSGHPTSSMSAADLMAVLITRYFLYDWNDPRQPNNDHLIFSKGHASPLLYAIFKAVGVITDDEMLTFRKFGSRLQGHPTPALPWVDVATGSLGQGLPIAVGVALAGRKLDQLPYHVWTLTGDSELTEGSIWEGLDKAGYYGLANFTAIFDINPLTQPVDIEDRREIRQAVVARLVESLPDGALRQLAVARERPHMVWQLIQFAAGEGHAHRDRQPLSQGARGDIDPGQRRRGMALQARPELAKGQHLIVGDDAHRLEDRVKQRRRVALGEDEVVVVRLSRVVPVIQEVPRDE